MVLNITDRNLQWSRDMVMRKMLCFMIMIILCIMWLFSNRMYDATEYDSMKQVLQQTNKQFKDTKNELESLIDNLKEKCTIWDADLPIIYGITPTYTRPVQKAELTRLSYTLRWVQNFHWIVVEDANQKSNLVANLLKYSLLNYTHLAEPTPVTWKRKVKEPKWKKPRGVSQRNAAIKWLRENRNRESDRGVVYFADDDNTYSLKVFQEMRDIKKVGVWPVGLVGGLMVEKPIIDELSGRVIGWNSHWRPERDFPIDMAGFAINLQFLLEHPKAQFSFKVERGFQESDLLAQLVTLDQLEPKADNCTKVYVWHTRTEEPHLEDEKILRKSGHRSDLNIVV